MSAPPLAADGWEPALAAALIGADRAPPLPVEELFAQAAPAGDAAALLLARLAAHGLHHRAGTALPAEALAPVPERAPSGPDCPPAAAQRLQALLTDGPAALVADWCGCAAAAGLRAPTWLLPLLGGHGRQHPEMRAVIAAVAGPELAWLARACADGPEERQELSGEAPDGDGRDDSWREESWQHGTWQERRAAFAAFRGRDPAAARAALVEGFRAEKAAMREHLLAAMSVGLSAADEPFLEACLDDRAAGVRRAARDRLLRLPGSRLSLRMAERARAAVSIERRRGVLGGLLGGAKPELVVTLPEESPELVRDGIEPSADDAQGGGRRAGLLRDILACAPLDAFAVHPPPLWIEAALRSAWSMPVVEGLLACVRDCGDPAWARAMAATLGEAWAGRLAGVKRTAPLLDMWVRATALLPDAEWEQALVGSMRAGQTEPVLAMLGKGPGTLSESFTAAFLDWLAPVTRGPSTLRDDLARSRILDGLAARLHPGEAAATSAAGILARLPKDTGQHLYRQIAGLAETLELRAAIRREFA